MKEKIASGHLDLALAWDDGPPSDAETIATLPLCWLGPTEEPPLWRQAGADDPLPLAVLEAPCLLRTLACARLDQAGIAWRIAFVSPSLSGLWAATAAGLGIVLRTSFGCPSGVRVLDAEDHTLPSLPSLGLNLLSSGKPDNRISSHLATIIRQALRDRLPEAWITREPLHKIPPEEVGAA